ncbi:hypothetical protein F5880DRAFT_1550189 [Lentinula raphanica]|nr:hypothetical protein F5880DRAFT_1550189 [Lentinula raphanica]
MFLLSVLLTAVWGSSLLWQVRCAEPSLNVPACSSQFNSQWSVNTKGQSPCQVAGYLGSVCFDNTFIIPALIPGSQFYSLSSAVQSDCTCSTVYYSVLSACASCQGATFISWAEWSTNCSTVFLDIYPEAIPSGTVVPHWAYQDISGSASFNVTLAQLAGDLPESSAAASSSTTATLTTSSPTSQPSIPIVSPTASSHDTNALSPGAIAGCVVGALAGVCIIIFVIIFRPGCRRKKAVAGAGVTTDVDMSLAVPTPFTLGQPSTNTISKPYDSSDHAPSEEMSDSRRHYLSWTGTTRLSSYSGMPEI